MPLITHPTVRLTLLGSIFWLLLSGCSPLNTALKSTAAIPTVAIEPRPSPARWAGDFADPNWRTVWGIRQSGAWGTENMTVLADTNRFARILRVYFPAGSASPAVSRQEKAPIGGGQFLADLGIAPQTALRLSYYVRFSNNFDFVRGGKLPGLFGGIGNSGGNIPNGQDGFSTRFMWRTDGAGEVYAYLPTSTEHGTSIGRGNWQFQRGVWHHIEQEVVLNRPNERSGRIRVWFDDRLVLDQGGLVFRTTDRLKINGLFFSTFFGGDDASWATPRNVYADFANFSVSTVNAP